MTEPTPGMPRTYTDEHVAQLIELAYEAGWVQAFDAIADGYAELNQTWRAHAEARLSYEERVAARRDALPPTDPDWLAKSAARQRAHDRMNIALGQRFAPAQTPRQAAA